MASNTTKQNDFDPNEYTSRMEGLEEFKKEFSGENFVKKICEALKESKSIEEEIGKIIWATMKNKFWIFLGGLVALILTDLVIRAIPNILEAISK